MTLHLFLIASNSSGRESALTAVVKLIEQVAGLSIILCWVLQTDAQECCMQAMLQDCKKLFMVPSFLVILLAESIAAVGASGTGYQVLYIEVSPSVHTSRQ